jgi:hypothetical protein
VGDGGGGGGVGVGVVMEFMCMLPLDSFIFKYSKLPIFFRNRQCNQAPSSIETLSKVDVLNFETTIIWILWSKMTLNC